MPNIIPTNDDPRNVGQTQGTLFPEMKEGGSPGEVESGDDITGLVLKGLSDNDNAQGQGGGGAALSLAPSPAMEGAPAPQGQPGVVVEDTTPQDHPGKPRTAAQRIAQLTQRYRSEQRARGEVETQLSQVLDVMRQQGQELRELRGTLARPPSGAAVPQDMSDDPLGLAGAQPSPAKHADPTTGIPMTPETISAIVTNAIGAYDQKVQERQTAREQLATSQEQSFGEALQEMPALGDKRTQAFKVFSEIYETSPLRTLPDGPYQIALQVRGILADEGQAGAAMAAAPAAQEERLRHASLTPQTSANDIPQGDRATMLKEYNAIINERKRGNDDFNLYRRMRYLREALKTQQR